MRKILDSYYGHPQEGIRVFGEKEEGIFERKLELHYFCKLPTTDLKIQTPKFEVR